MLLTPRSLGQSVAHSKITLDNTPQRGTGIDSGQSHPMSHFRPIILMTFPRQDSERPSVSSGRCFNSLWEELRAAECAATFFREHRDTFVCEAFAAVPSHRPLLPLSGRSQTLPHKWHVRTVLFHHCSCTVRSSHTLGAQSSAAVVLEDSV